MPRKRSSTKDRIDEFKIKMNSSDPDSVKEAIREALTDSHCLIVKKAAELCEENLYYDFEPELIKSYRRFLKNPKKKDPQCIAKTAIVRTLVALDSQEVDFFLEGIRYMQLEPVWGGTEDSAIDIRTGCAMGLANTSYPRAVVELVTLLHDNSAPVRKGAIRAISITQPLAAEAVLRTKSLEGDLDPDVTGQALGALLQVTPNESKDFVYKFLELNNDQLLHESVALALGDSKTIEALEILRTCWDNEPLKAKQGTVWLLGAIIHRSEEAFAWLLDVVADGDRASATFIVEQLAIYKRNKKLRGQLKAALSERSDDILTSIFPKYWN